VSHITCIRTALRSIAATQDFITTRIIIYTDSILAYEYNMHVYVLRRGNDGRSYTGTVD